MTHPEDATFWSIWKALNDRQKGIVKDWYLKRLSFGNFEKEYLGRYLVEFYTELYEADLEDSANDFNFEIYRDRMNRGE